MKNWERENRELNAISITDFADGQKIPRHNK